MSQVTKKALPQDNKKNLGHDSASAAHQAHKTDTVSKPDAVLHPSPRPEAAAQQPHKAAETISPVNETASRAVEKSASAVFSNLETVHRNTKAAVTAGTDKIKEIFASTTQEVQKKHSRVLDMGREGTEHVSRTLDAFERTINDVLSLGRQNVDVAVEVSHIVADIARTSGAEIIRNANHNFSGHLDVCNELLGCRTVRDAYAVGNKWLAINIESAFANSSAVSEMLFQLISEASEPLNEHILESTERLGKTFAA